MPRTSLRRLSTHAAVRAAAAARRAAPVEDEPVRVQEDVLRAGDVTGLQRRLKFVVTGQIQSTAADCRSVEVPQLRLRAALTVKLLALSLQMVTGLFAQLVTKL